MQPAVEQEQEEGGAGGEDRESGRQRDRDKETIEGGAERQTDSAARARRRVTPKNGMRANGKDERQLTESVSPF